MQRAKPRKPSASWLLKTGLSAGAAPPSQVSTPVTHQDARFGWTEAQSTQPVWAAKSSTGQPTSSSSSSVPKSRPDKGSGLLQTTDPVKRWSDWKHTLAKALRSKEAPEALVQSLRKGTRPKPLLPKKQWQAFWVRLLQRRESNSGHGQLPAGRAEQLQQKRASHLAALACFEDRQTERSCLGLEHPRLEIWIDNREVDLIELLGWLPFVHVAELKVGDIQFRYRVPGGWHVLYVFERKHCGDAWGSIMSKRLKTQTAGMLDLVHASKAFILYETPIWTADAVLASHAHTDLPNFAREPLSLARHTDAVDSCMAAMVMREGIAWISTAHCQHTATWLLGAWRHCVEEAAHSQTTPAATTSSSSSGPFVAHSSSAPSKVSGAQLASPPQQGGDDKDDGGRRRQLMLRAAEERNQNNRRASAKLLLGGGAAVTDPDYALRLDRLALFSACSRLTPTAAQVITDSYPSTLDLFKAAGLVPEGAEASRLAELIAKLSQLQAPGTAKTLGTAVTTRLLERLGLDTKTVDEKRVRSLVRATKKKKQKKKKPKPAQGSQDPASDDTPEPVATSPPKEPTTKKQKKKKTTKQPAKKRKQPPATETLASKKTEKKRRRSKKPKREQPPSPGLAELSIDTSDNEEAAHEWQDPFEKAAPPMPQRKRAARKRPTPNYAEEDDDEDISAFSPSE